MGVYRHALALVDLQRLPRQVAAERVLGRAGVLPRGRVPACLFGRVHLPELRHKGGRGAQGQGKRRRWKGTLSEEGPTTKMKN